MKYLLWSSLLFLISCSALTGEEIARISNEISTTSQPKSKEVVLQLKKGDEIEIWSDMDFEWDKKVELRFLIELLKEGEKYTDYEINPIVKSVSVGDVKTELFGSHKWYFFGKNSTIKIEEDASYTFKVILIASDNPSLRVNRADIVLIK